MQKRILFLFLQTPSKHIVNNNYQTENRLALLLKQVVPEVTESFLRDIFEDASGCASEISSKIWMPKNRASLGLQDIEFKEQFISSRS